MADPPDRISLDYRRVVAPRHPGPPHRAAPWVAASAALVAIAGICVFLAPSTNYSREMARRARCQSDLSQVGLAVGRYAAAHGGTYPDTLERLISDAGLSPSDIAFGYDYIGAGLTTRTATATTVVAFESGWSRPDGSVALFGDGHAVWLGRKAAVAFLPPPTPTTR